MDKVSKAAKETCARIANDCEFAKTRQADRDKFRRKPYDIDGKWQQKK